MEIVKVGLVIAAGLGSTWAAREATDLMFGSPQSQSLVQTTEQKPPAGSTTPPATSETPAEAPKIPEISRQEMEDELKRAQAEISGKPAPGDNEEFRPSKPLAADVAISLPSDM